MEGVVPGDDDDEEQNVNDVSEVETLLIEDAELLVSFPSCSRGADEHTLDFKIFWNQPDTRKTNLIIDFNIYDSLLVCTSSHKAMEGLN